MGAGMAGTQPWTSPGMCAFLGSGFEITPLSSTKGPNLFCFLGSEQFFLLNASSVLPVRNHLAEGQPPALVERQAGEGVSDYPKQDTGSHREGACTLSWECELGTHPSIASDMANTYEGTPQNWVQRHLCHLQKATGLSIGLNFSCKMAINSHASSCAVGELNGGKTHTSTIKMNEYQKPPSLLSGTQSPHLENTAC